MPEQAPRLRSRAPKWQPKPPVRWNPASLLACALRARMVVHTMWTIMWMSVRRQEGGAGE
jgi:hypothetical protein